MCTYIYIYIYIYIYFLCITFYEQLELKKVKKVCCENAYKAAFEVDL